MIFLPLPYVFDWLGEQRANNLSNSQSRVNSPIQAGLLKHPLQLARTEWISQSAQPHLTKVLRLSLFVCMFELRLTLRMYCRGGDWTWRESAWRGMWRAIECAVWQPAFTEIIKQKWDWDAGKSSETTVLLRSERPEPSWCVWGYRIGSGLVRTSINRTYRQLHFRFVCRSASLLLYTAAQPVSSTDAAGQIENTWWLQLPSKQHAEHCHRQREYSEVV